MRMMSSLRWRWSRGFSTRASLSKLENPTHLWRATLVVTMAASFFFYDLETSGFAPRAARVMQFGGQRTDMELQPIGEPVNVLIKLSEDVVPDPDAILVTGITPAADAC